VAKGSTEAAAPVFFLHSPHTSHRGAFQATESVINLFETIFGLLDEACVGLDFRQRASDIQFVGRPRQNIVLPVATVRSDLEERVILRARAKPSDRSDANVRCPL
jgi:hypothetical protein